MAFPKTQSGNELMTNSPSELSSQELESYGIQLLKEVP
jgi:aspartyl-tRNA synthetase